MNLLKPWNLVFFIGFVIYLAIRGRYARATRGNQHQLRRADVLDLTLLVFVIVSSSLLPVLYLFTPMLSFADMAMPIWMPWIGLALMFAALWLFWRSHADLGLNFSVTMEIRTGHQLIRHGVYRTIRHPMYSSIFLWSLAQGFLLANWLAGWCALVAFTPLYLYRVAREERMMSEIFGDDYNQYMRKTGRLFPHRQK